jgi:hypothetical protein
VLKVKPFSAIEKIVERSVIAAMETKFDIEALIGIASYFAKGNNGEHSFWCYFEDRVIANS